MTTHPKYGFSNGPFYYLGKYKTTQRPRVCERCTQSAYYYHDDWGWCCAAHLLDLVNIGELAFSWGDYKEVWDRCERLLQREPRKSGTVKNVDVDMTNAALWDESLDGYKSLMEEYDG
jgi:hypothetical protein